MANQGVTSLFRVLYAIAFITNITGNIFICHVVKKYKKLHNFTSFLLVNLAASDLTLGICGTIHLVTSIIDGKQSALICSIMSTAVYFSAAVSVNTIVVLAVERCIAVTRPFYSRSVMTKSKLKVIIPAVWSLAGIISLPSFIFFTEKSRGLHYLRLPCWDALTQDNFPQFYKVILLLFLYLLPMAIIAVSYAKIFR